MKTGSVTLVGAGPGDPDLITVKGCRALESADVVVFDRLVGEEIIAMIPQKAKRIDVGKSSGRHPVSQEEINRILVENARQGNHVVRLKGGDPFLFGRGGEEIEAIIASGIPFREISGVTSAIAAPAAAGIPVTHRDFCSSVHIITGHSRQGGLPAIDFTSLAKLSGTLVFLMGVQSLPDISKGLTNAGMDADTPAAIVENGTTAKQRKLVATLHTLPEKAVKARIQSPAVIVVGPVCTLSDQLDWVSKQPLSGIRVMITRPLEAGDRLSRKLRELGADVVPAPCISTMPIDPNPALEQVIEEIRDWNWLVFTSGFGVRTFFNRIFQEGGDARSIGHAMVAAVGPGTARVLREYGVRADLLPGNYDGEHLGQALAGQLRPGDRVLLCRAAAAEQSLPRALRETGIPYLDLPVYQTLPMAPGFDLRGRLDRGDIDYVTFTSASTVEGFVKALGPGGIPVVHGLCIGLRTARKAAEYGIRMNVPACATIDGIVDALVKLEGKGGIH